MATDLTELATSLGGIAVKADREWLGHIGQHFNPAHGRHSQRFE